MRKFIAAAGLSLVLASQAHATGMAETLVEPEVIAEETRQAGSGGFVLPLILLALIAAVASGGGSGTPGEPPIDCPLKTGCF